MIFCNLDKIDQDLADYWGELSAAQKLVTCWSSSSSLRVFKKEASSATLGVNLVTFASLRR